MHEPKKIDLPVKEYPEGHSIRMLPSNGQDDLRLEINRAQTTHHGRNFKFRLRGHYLEPEAGENNSDGNKNRDWYKALTEKEKLDLMQVVAGHYRKASLDPQGMKTAAIAIVENPDPKPDEVRSNLIYVGLNTTSDVSKNDKRCAERNAIDTGKQAMTEFFTHRAMAAPKLNPFKELYVMGGRDANPAIPGDRGVAGICPCGTCTDMLAKEMKPGSKIYVFPQTDGWEDLEINDSASMFSEVGTDANGKQKIWKTTVDHLNQHRNIALDAQPALMQQRGLDWLISALKKEAKQPTQYAVADDYQSAIELAAATKNAVPDPEVVNTCLRRELLKTLSDRMHRDFPDQVPEEEALRTWLENTVHRVRCCIIRTSNGRYYIGKDSETGSEKAFVNAESAAISAAIDSLGQYGVEKSWAMEVSPAHLRKGELTTATKDGLERLFKRAVPNDPLSLTICDIPLNDGKMSKQEAAELVEQFTLPIGKIYPGLFSGTGIGTRPVAHSHTSTETHFFINKYFRANKDFGPPQLEK